MNRFLFPTVENATNDETTYSTDNNNRDVGFGNQRVRNTQEEPQN
jgi:hypothetical protein